MYFHPIMCFFFLLKGGLFIPFHSEDLSEIEKKKIAFSMLLVSIEYLVLIDRILYSLEFLWL